MQSNEVRQNFLDFFEKKSHKIISSAPVIPAQDPTLLFTNAGMNQFKEVFLGTGKRDYNRVANSQKCIRVSGKHNDLEEVGVDSYHHTFFEMLGNWSFGDYYKKEAIIWAWELITDFWKIDKNRIYATVFEEDDEAENLWCAETDILKGRVSRLGKEENFWEMGDTGPCGPCSELHYDYGEEYACGPDCSIECGCGRFVEIWNLVFIQYNREPGGKLVELTDKHVDTGMGFERITAVLNNFRSNYDIDIFQNIFKAVDQLTNIKYEEETFIGVTYRVIADHIRALTFAIADGALPSNEGRGYVLRRILRRAARYSRNLDVHEPLLYKLVDPLVDSMGSVYNEIVEKADYIKKVIRSEEDSFGNTLDRGIEIFNKIAEKTKRSGSQIISGKDAFKLYDTYGFPFDLTQLMAREMNLSIDTDIFNDEMAAQKERSFRKKAFQVMDVAKNNQIVNEFSYEKNAIDTKIGSILNGKGEVIESAEKGDIVQIQLAGDTPFYPESGGQVGDTGSISSPDGINIIEVNDTQKISETVILHVGIVKKGAFKPQDAVIAEIDTARRLDIMRNHTATHLLHKALRSVLGTHVTQAGSLVAPSHLRFDFNHFSKMTDDELENVETIVNENIRMNSVVVPEEEVPIEDAKKNGAMALFGEKYGDRVRTISIGDYSVELCGGTHIDSTGKIGEFRIVSESAAAAGIRRIVAETGDASYRRTKNEREIISHLRNMFNLDDSDIISKVDHLINENKELTKNFKDERQRSSFTVIEQMIDDAEKSQKNPLIAHSLVVNSVDELKEAGDLIRSKMPSGAALLGTELDNKGMLVCVVGDEMIKNNKWHAGNIIKEIAKKIGGGGGGRPHMATAGIKNTKKLKEALSIFPEVVENMYNN
ncbi:alanine--tRNA ligase [candidate division KSB1 bacterium]